MRRTLRSGFSLLEVMISLAVLAFVLLAFLSIMTSAAQLTNSTREGLLATYELQSAVEDTLGIPFANFIATYVPGSASWPPAGSRPPVVVGNYNTSPGGTNPLIKYWCLSATQPGVLQQEAMYIDVLGQSPLAPAAPSVVTYQITVRWLTHKGSYQQDTMIAQRSSR